MCIRDSASNTRDFLDVLDIERATIVGQSFGGGVALQFAYQFPEICERLVLVDAGGLGREVNLMLRLVTLPGAEHVFPLVFPAFAGRYGRSVAQFLDRRGIHNPAAGEIWSSYESLTYPANRRGFVRTMRAVIDPGGQKIDARDRLYLAAEIPSMIVWGEQDSVIPVEHGVRAHELMPGSRLELFPTGGHFPFNDDPLRFISVLHDFIQTTAPSSLDENHVRNLLNATAQERASAA